MQMERGQQGTAHIQAFIWVASRCRRTGITKLFGDGANPHIEACRKPKNAEQFCRNENNLRTYQTSEKRKRNYMAKGAVHTWQRRATAYCQALIFKLSQPSVPPVMSNTQEAFSNLVLQLPYHEIQNLTCFGCVAEVAGTNPDLRDIFRDQLLITLGAVTANRDAQSGLTDIAETSLSIGTNRMNA